MKEQQRKPLTHKKCVQSNHLILKCLLSASALLPIVLTIFLGVTGKEILILVLFSVIFLICGIIFLLLSIKTNKKLQAGSYFLYIDTVSGKRKQQGQKNMTYYLQFANNKYEKKVSQKVYDTIKMDEPYYLLQLNDAKRAIAAFAESEYYLAEDVQKHLTSI